MQGGAAPAGAAGGNYQARLLLADDDFTGKQLAVKAIHPRFLQFDKSGLAVQVPAAEIVSLKVTRR